MAIEKEPSLKVPRNHFPSNTKRYQVKDGDSWITIAQQHKVGLEKLIYVNFKTHDPREVNWYLRNYVGCTKQTNDGKNYIFSSNDKPGIIYIPLPEKIVMPPIHVSSDPSKKLVTVGLIEKEVLFGVDSFGMPGSVKWAGSKYIIREKYERVPKSYVEHGMLKSPSLYYNPTAFSKTTIRRYEVIWGPKESLGKIALKASEKAAWFIIKVVTNQLEGGTGTNVYGSWKVYPRDPNDPLNKFRPPNE